MKKLAVIKIIRSACAGALGTLALQGCLWTSVYEQGQQPLETQSIFSEDGSAVQHLVLEDLNKDGVLDVVALLGPPKANGVSYMEPLAPGRRVMALAGDGQGGFKSLFDLDVADVKPTNLGVWHPTNENTQVAVYGTNAAGEGVVQLISVGSAQVDGVSSYNVGGTADRVSMRATNAGTGGSQQLVVGGTFGPSPNLNTGEANNTNTGTPTSRGEIKVLDNPQSDTFTTIGPLELPGAGAYGASSALAVADFNGDGRLDVVVADESQGGVVVNVQQADGTFRAQAPVAWGIYDIPVQVITGDFNADQRTDVRVIFESCHDAYYQNDGEQLAEPSVFHTVMDPTLHAVIADLDGDNDQDMLLTGINGAVEVLLLDNQGKVEQQSARRVVIADAPSTVDEDASLAVRVAQNMAHKVGAAAKALGTHFSPVTGEVMAAGADINKDGKPDLLFGTNDGKILLHLGN